MQYYARIKKQEDGKFLVEFPGLDGCFTEGDNLAEAKANASEVLNLWLSASCEAGDAYPIPKPKRKRRGKDYFPIEVEPLLIPAILLKQTRMNMSLTRSGMARKLGLSTEDYTEHEIPITLPRGWKVKRKIRKKIVTRFLEEPASVKKRRA